jgi:hypothetical protein
MAGTFLDLRGVLLAKGCVAWGGGGGGGGKGGEGQAARGEGGGVGGWDVTAAAAPRACTGVLEEVAVCAMTRVLDEAGGRSSRRRHVTRWR